MGNSPPHSKEREAPPKFRWIESGMVEAEDLDLVWSYYSKDGKTILKGDTIAFAEEVVSQYEVHKGGALSLDEALLLDHLVDERALFKEIHSQCELLTYKDFLKLFFTLLNKINITFAKDLRDVYIKVGLEQNVYLHIYDLSESVCKLNDYTLSLLGFGAFHTGVEIFKRELSFGFPNGIFVCKPKQAATGAVYRKTILMGTVSISHNEVLELIKQLKEEWKGEDYDVINANCNHFCNELCMKLLNKGLPSYLTKIADFMSLFVKDSQDFGFLDGKGSLSYSASLNGSIENIGAVKSEGKTEDDSFKEKVAMSRNSSANHIKPMSPSTSSNSLTPSVTPSSTPPQTPHIIHNSTTPVNIANSHTHHKKRRSKHKRHSSYNNSSGSNNNNSVNSSSNNNNSISNKNSTNNFGVVNVNNSINVTSINININNNNSASDSPRVSTTARSTTVNSTNTIANSVTIPIININNNSISNSPRAINNTNNSDTSNLKKENMPTKKKSRTWGLVNSTNSIEDVVNEKKTRKSKTELDSSTGSRSQPIQVQQTRPRAASSFGQIDARLLVTGIEPEKINEVTKNLSKTAHIPQRMNITANEESYVEMEQNSKGS